MVTSTRLMDSVVQKPKEEYARLLSVELSVPTDEQIAKAAATRRAGGNDPIPPQAQVVVRVEPMSYIIESEYGNVRTYYLPVTFGLDTEHVEAIRSGGWFGIPSNKMIRLSPKKGWADQEREWPRWFKRAIDNGLHLDFDDSGKLVSNDVGTVWRMEVGYDEFPVNEQVNGRWQRAKDRTNSRFMGYLVEKAPDYVAPENPPVVHIEPREGSGGAAVTAVATGGATGGGISADALRAAVMATGMIGKMSATLATAGQQVNFAAQSVVLAPIFGTSEVSEAADKGELIHYLIGKGVINIDNGVIVEAN